ncbi:QRFP-like peptide receptor [Cylas formicarius]|uniref:QRFP-like peptide receptor n=1 Tax=Cylas formicarius TaxID=197179 RepID=UPI002958453A|nr:QRFP-like peptide receptor [Cylas formicarius]XP_060526489.1 QRFP-like peptide receptor [Cylas formicarius]
MNYTFQNSSEGFFLSTATFYNSGNSLDNIYNKLRDDLRNDEFVVIGIYVPVFLLALIANVLLIVIVIKDRYMQNVTNYFLVNLSIADLLVTLICMPNAAWNAYTKYYGFGSLTCKITAYLQCIAVASSIFTITAMAIDRYLAIIRPFSLRYRCFKKTTTVIVILALWMFSLLLFCPNLWNVELQKLFPGTPIDIYMCTVVFSDFPINQDVLGIVWFIFMFAIPGLIMTVAYALMGRTLCSNMPPFDSNEPTCTQQRNRLLRSRKRVACILLLLAFVFAICWLPYHIANLIMDTNVLPVEQRKQIIAINPYLLLLGHANSALNPIIYCILSRNFRNSIKSLLKTKIRCKRRARPPPWVDSSASGIQPPSNKMIKAVPLLQPPHNDAALSRRQSSQKTTKTCAV